MDGGPLPVELVLFGAHLQHSLSEGPRAGARGHRVAVACPAGGWRVRHHQLQPGLHLRARPRCWLVLPGPFHVGGERCSARHPVPVHVHQAQVIHGAVAKLDR